MIEKLQADRLYRYESSVIRKKIRDLDIEQARIDSLSILGQKQLPRNINIAVVGPESSGKTSLIKYIPILSSQNHKLRFQWSNLTKNLSIIEQWIDFIGKKIFDQTEQTNQYLRNKQFTGPQLRDINFYERVQYHKSEETLENVEICQNFRIYPL